MHIRQLKVNANILALAANSYCHIRIGDATDDALAIAETEAALALEYIRDARADLERFLATVRSERETRAACAQNREHRREEEIQAGICVDVSGAAS